MYARIDTTRDWELYSDAELVRLLKRGQDEALEELLRRHRDALYRFCCHLMTTREDAEDICQETLARAITRVDSLQTGSAFRSWLFSIARNLSVDSFRTKKRTCPMPDDEAIPLPLYTETPQDRIEIHEEHQTVAEALGKLADSHQRVLMLREVNGLSYAAIAEEMQVTQSAVETLLFRARRRLREEYSKSAVPMIALLNDLRDLAMRFAAPVASGSAVTKLVVASALVGGGLATTAKVSPQMKQSLHAVPQIHVAARHQVAALQRPSRQVAAFVQAPLSTRNVPAAHTVVTAHTAVHRVARLHKVHRTRHVTVSAPPAPPAVPATHAPDTATKSLAAAPAPPAAPSRQPFLAVSAAPESAPAASSTAPVTKASAAASTSKSTTAPVTGQSSPSAVPTASSAPVTKSQAAASSPAPTTIPAAAPTPATQVYGPVCPSAGNGTYSPPVSSPGAGQCATRSH